MKKPSWQDGLKNRVDDLCEIFPPLIRDRWRRRLILNTERIAVYENLPVISEAVFWRSVYEVFPGGYEPLILKIKDPGQLQAEMSATRNQEEIASGTEPVRITCWAPLQSSQTAPPSPSEPPRILAVTSSMRKGGNTDTLIDELLRGCRETGCKTEKIYLGDLDIKPCTGCRACRKADVKTICTVWDDMTAVMYHKLFDMDGLVLGFPVYTARENAIMANFMDRWDCLANPKLTQKMPPGKKAVVVSTWMWPNPAAYDNIVEQMIILLKLHGIETVQALTVSGTRGKRHGRGVVKNHPQVLKTAYHAGIDFLKQLPRFP